MHGRKWQKKKLNGNTPPVDEEKESNASAFSTTETAGLEVLERKMATS